MKKVIPERGYGFATNAPDQDVFFHVHDFVNRVEFEALEEGDEIQFVPESVEKGIRAREVRVR